MPCRASRCSVGVCTTRLLASSCGCIDTDSPFQDWSSDIMKMMEIKQAADNKEWWENEGRDYFSEILSNVPTMLLSMFHYIDPVASFKCNYLKLTYGATVPKGAMKSSVISILQGQ